MVVAVFSTDRDVFYDEALKVWEVFGHYLEMSAILRQRFHVFSSLRHENPLVRDAAKSQPVDYTNLVNSSLCLGFAPDAYETTRNTPTWRSPTETLDP